MAALHRVAASYAARYDVANEKLPTAIKDLSKRVATTLALPTIPSLALAVWLRPALAKQRLAMSLSLLARQGRFVLGLRG